MSSRRCRSWLIRLLVVSWPRARGCSRLVLGAGLYAAVFFDPLPLSLGLFFVAFALPILVVGRSVRLRPAVARGPDGGQPTDHIPGVPFGLHFDAVRRFLSVTAVFNDFFRSCRDAFWVWVRRTSWSFLWVPRSSSVLCLLYLVTARSRRSVDCARAETPAHDRSGRCFRRGR